MLSTFDRAFSYTMGWEGGDTVTNDPDDPGGVTRWGVSQRAHPNWDIANLTEEQARKIYLTDYWLPLNCPGVAALDEQLAAKLFDMGVNLGVHRAAKMFQSALAELSPGLAVDGHIGPATLTVLSGADHDSVRELTQARLENYYKSLNNPRFEKGWLNRAKTWPEA